MHSHAPERGLMLFFYVPSSEVHISSEACSDLCSGACVQAFLGVSDTVVVCVLK